MLTAEREAQIRACFSDFPNPIATDLFDEIGRLREVVAIAQEALVAIWLNGPGHETTLLASEALSKMAVLDGARPNAPIEKGGE